MQAPFGITVCGLDELDSHRETAASHVLSILDPDHPVPEAFGHWGEHSKIELRFHDIIEDVPGQIAPTAEDVAAVLSLGESLRHAQEAGRAGGHLLVHCHAGISRSTASMALILAQALPEASGEAVIAMVHGIREKAWPNLRIIELGDAVLGRGGSLVAATHRLHRLQLERRPHLAEVMSEAGRAREVQAAQSLEHQSL